MSPKNAFPRSLAIAVPLALVVGLGLAGSDDRPTTSSPAVDHSSHAGHHAMDAAAEAAMRRSLEDFYRAHPQRIPAPAGVPAAVFRLTGFAFDADNNGGTPVDTATIFAGETVEWRLVDGTHSTTSGTGGMDPQAGALFDVSMPPTTSFTFTYPNPGIFPFFCRPHEGFGMFGAVRVVQVSDVTPIDGRTDRRGFVGGPSPNPARDRTTFRFALREAGRVQVEVFDARGRRVAVAVDREVRAGTYIAAWDGKAAGEPAPAGVYYLRLQGPGVRDRAQVTVVR